MANQFIGGRKPPDEVQNMSKKDDKPARRAWRYTNGDRKIFVGDEAIAAAEKDGWVDSPTKVKPAKNAAGK